VVLFMFMVSDYLIAVLLAGVFSGLLYPLYQRLLRFEFLGNHPGITSFLLLVLAIVAIGIPLTALLGLITSEAIQISENVTPWLKENLLPELNNSRQLPHWIPFADLLNPYMESIIGTLGEATSAIGTLLAKSGSMLTQGTLTFLLNLFVMLYAMFYFLMKGPQWLHAVGGYLPLTDADEQQLISRGLSVTSASLKGILGIGLLQGFLIGLAFWVIGIEGAAFWGAIVLILSAVPAIGPPLVWIPAVMYLLLTGQTGLGIGLAIWGIVVVGLVDNILRPRIVSSATRIPDLLIFVSILGGIAMFGATGIILGPIVAAGLVTLLEIYRHAFVRNLPT
ncbi:MAG: AI-2E family transporter, partial [Pseudohongiellaceae bacterium]